jgi:hypothetical protein
VEPGNRSLVALATGGLIVDQQTREPFFINALVTERFVLQAARGAMIGEMVGRGSIYLGTVSSALIAFGFIAQPELRLAPFVAAVLPALFVLGELTFVALLRDSFQNPTCVEAGPKIGSAWQAGSLSVGSYSTPTTQSMTEQVPEHLAWQARGACRSSPPRRRPLGLGRRTLWRGCINELLLKEFEALGHFGKLPPLGDVPGVDHINQLVHAVGARVAHGVIEPIHRCAQLVDEWVVRPLEVAARPGLGDGRRLAIDRHAADRARRQLQILWLPRCRRHLLIMRLTPTFGYRLITRAQICNVRLQHPPANPPSGTLDRAVGARKELVLGASWHG